ncbi:unnamed protein product [Cuscuta campestris]|uniref:Uncharacterized protein n=1 Tax=Cuscuta campestris TaxID=132261 RepID=A0A484MWQ7_9ASTE|nr:unnamed protein product [Cuscuta campestris]
MAGEDFAGDQNDRPYNSQSLHVTSAVQHNIKPPPPVGPRSTMRDESHHSFGGHFTEAPSNPMDKPLEFAPHVNRDHGLHMPSNYSYSDSVGPLNGVDPASEMTSTYAWPPTTVGIEPAMVGPSPVPGLPAPVFGRLPAPNFHSTVPSVGPNFGINNGPAGATSIAFPLDGYEMSTDRPKKASVPNWLREEIIKKKAVITSSAPDLQREDVLEDEDINKPYRRGDQLDSKSIDSSRSTEEEDDDDEDDADAARTAAINQEIKRVLTEVLLKVTDELFDEIATKVLSEDVLSLEAEPNSALSSHKVSSSAHDVLTPKASATVLVPFKTKENSDSDSKKSSSGPPGNVLGLADYASDGDDNEIQSYVNANVDKVNYAEQSIVIKPIEGKKPIENGSSHEKIEKDGSISDNVENAMKTNPDTLTVSFDKVGTPSSDDRATIELVREDSRPSSKTKLGLAEETVAEEADVEIEGPNKNFDSKKRKPDHSHIREGQNNSDKSGARYSTADDISKCKHKDIDNIKDRTFKTENDNHKYVKDEKTNVLDNKKDRVKDKNVKSAQKEEPDSRKKASIDTSESKGMTGRENRSSAKGDIGKGREKNRDERREKSRRKDESDSGKHRRQRSSSIGSRGRENKDNLVSYPTDSNDESSDDYKRKLYSRRRRSPSPVRARKRQVSRSPRSKHSQRRHSPYSSLEPTRYSA